MSCKTAVGTQWGDCPEAVSTQWGSCPSAVGTIWDLPIGCCHQDTFTAPNGTLLQNHTPEVGSWIKESSDDAPINSGEASFPSGNAIYRLGCDVAEVASPVIRFKGTFGGGNFYAAVSANGLDFIQIGFVGNGNILTFSIFNAGSPVNPSDQLDVESTTTYDLTLTIEVDRATLTGIIEPGHNVNFTQIAGAQMPAGSVVRFVGADDFALTVNELSVCPASG